MNFLNIVPPSLPKKFKKKSFMFILFSIVAVILETFSLGLIFPCWTLDEAEITTVHDELAAAKVLLNKTKLN